jgi:hypothetical protein
MPKIIAAQSGILRRVIADREGIGRAARGLRPPHIVGSPQHAPLGLPINCR